MPNPAEDARGAGQPGLAVALDADETVRSLGAEVADISDPEPAPP